MKYELDLENSRFNYITPTQKKYFDLALVYALNNDVNNVKVNRIYYSFDFNNREVLIATGRKDFNNNGVIYKLKEAK